MPECKVRTRGARRQGRTSGTGSAHSTRAPTPPPPPRPLPFPPRFNAKYNSLVKPKIQPPPPSRRGCRESRLVVAVGGAAARGGALARERKGGSAWRPPDRAAAAPARGRNAFPALGDPIPPSSAISSPPPPRALTPRTARAFAGPARWWSSLRASNGGCWAASRGGGTRRLPMRGADTSPPKPC